MRKHRPKGGCWLSVADGCDGDAHKRYITKTVSATVSDSSALYHLLGGQGSQKV